MMQADALIVEWREFGLDQNDLSATLTELNAQSSRPCPFFTPEYLNAYAAHNELFRPEQMQLFILVVRDARNGHIVGALPLKRVWNWSRLIPYRQIEFLVTTEVDIPILLAAPEHQHAVAQAIMRKLPAYLGKASVIQLLRQPIDSALYQARNEAKSLAASVYDYQSMPISHIPLRFANLAEYFAALNQKMRSNVSRLARKLFSEGTLEYLTSSDPSVTADLYNLYLYIEDRSWKHGKDASMKRHPERVAMYRRLHADAKLLEHHIDVLLHNGVPVAGMISMHLDQTHIAMETCYDERYSESGAGNLMMLLAIARSIRLGSLQFGMHGHFEYYKHRWLAEATETRDIRIIRKLSMPALFAWVGGWLRQLKGHTDKELVRPQGRPEATATAPQAIADQSFLPHLRKIYANPAVTHLNRPALQALLPFPVITNHKHSNGEAGGAGNQQQRPAMMHTA